MLVFTAIIRTDFNIAPAKYKEAVRSTVNNLHRSIKLSRNNADAADDLDAVKVSSATAATSDAATYKNAAYPCSEEASDDDPDSELEFAAGYKYEDTDDDDEGGIPSTGAMSLSLMRALGLEVSESADCAPLTDWTPPAHSGLQNSTRELSLLLFALK